MAYKQWIAMKIQNRLRKGSIRVKDAKHISGKFYRGSKDNEITPEEVDNTVIPPQGQATISACGRESASMGTEGYLTLYEWDGEHETMICTLYWSAPWGSSPNKFEVQEWNPSTSNYSIVHDEVPTDGTIGYMTVVVAKLA